MVYEKVSINSTWKRLAIKQKSATNERNYKLFNVYI